ncbi:MAG: serine/threonine-protein kinase [Pseudomonadota bacterium]
MSDTQKTPVSAPERIGKYPIIKKVGRGSTGTVYLSHDLFYGRDVAIKVYHGVNSNSDDARVARKMFFNEANMVGRLQHANILPIYDAGEHDNSYYVVMEHVQGARTLARFCKDENLLRKSDVIEIAFKCAKALHYAHNRGVVHRDIKPSNIMLTPDRDVRIIDFGIALVEQSAISQIEGIAGSPSYMSPEQVRSQQVTPRSDLDSLGVVLYELLAGQRPFKADNLAKLLHLIVYRTPQPLHMLRDDIPESLEHVVMRALHKDPDQRYRNGLEMAADLTRANQELSRSSVAMRVTEQGRFELLRQLRFFHDFQASEIWEVLQAGEWREYAAGEEIVREGQLDDRFYVIIKGGVKVHRGGRTVGALARGDCFGESSYVRRARRTASIQADEAVTLLQVSSTLLEQLSSACQLRFMRVFLRTLVERLQNVEAELSGTPLEVDDGPTAPPESLANAG